MGDPKVRDHKCVRSACREGHGAGANNPGKGSKDSDCCGAKGDTGCDVGYVHSIMNDAAWAKIGGRTAGFSGCNTLSSHVGNTCCTKGVDPCNTNNGGCHSARKCTSTGGVATCGKCGDGFYNDGAKGCKATCTRSACREGLGAGANNPGHGSKDSDCCGGKGATGCDVGYVHSIVKAADWAKIPGGRPAGFSTCNTLSSHDGNTCCTKVDPTVRAKACVLSVCREHDGAGRNNPGKGKRDGDCCGAKGNTGCDVGYVHSLMNDADWAKIGGRTAGFKTCNSLNQQGNTCCTKGVDPCHTNNGGCHAKRECTSKGAQVTCGNCAAGFYNDGAKGCKQDPCKTNNGGCHAKRKCTSKGAQVTCGKCGDGFHNDGAKGCKQLTCVRSACREGHGAGANNPGKGSKDSDCCGKHGTTGCDLGYVHSLMKDADWAKIPGGRPAGFSACNTWGNDGNTCCIKVDDSVRLNKCVKSACLEHGKRDGDCCGSKGNTGCATGYKHSLMTEADWAKIGGRAPGFSYCRAIGNPANTCCTKL